MTRKRPRSEQRQNEIRKSFFSFTDVTTTRLGAMLLILSSFVEASTNGFPGTLQGSSTSASTLSDNWWLSSSFESSSSSEWEWEPDDATSSSDAGETMNNDNPSQEDENGAEVVNELLNQNQNKTKYNTFQNTKGQPHETQTSSDSSPSTKPLQTLQKLQQMLDETDYMTTGRTTYNANGAQDELWTSKDRSKYKKQQKKNHYPKRILEMVEESSQSNTAQATPAVVPPPPPQTSNSQQQGWYPPPPPQYYQPHFNSATGDLQATSEAETTENSDTDGDGLGYTLPNLPIYLSDNEDEGADSDASIGLDAAISTMSSRNQAQNQATTTSSSPRQQTNTNNAVPQQVTPASWQQQQQQYQQQLPPHPQQYQPPPPQQQQQWYGYPYVPPPPPPTAYQQPQAQTYPYAWGPPPPQPFYYPRPYVPRVDTTRRPLPQQQRPQGASMPRGNQQPQPVYYQHPHQQQQQHQQQVPESVQRDSIETSTTSDQSQSQSMVSFPVAMEAAALAATSSASSHMIVVPQTKNGGSILWNLIQMGSCVSLAMFVAYSAIPSAGQNLSLYEFNQQYYEVLKLVAWTSLPPLVTFWFGMVDVLDDERSSMLSANGDEDGSVSRRNPHKTTMSKLISAFFNSFTWGYCLLFALQVAATTIARLGIFFRWERPVFDLTPKIPVLIIPWVLRENGYKPKRITLIVQDFVASCLLGPILEEYLKVVLLQMTRLPKNFQWRRVTKKHKKAMVAELVDNPQGEVTNVNAYISNMLAVTLGIKLADSIRRVCMYTKPQNAAKTFYAIFRGVFPVRELCGTITALGLARRDVLGQYAPLWKILLPATVIHGMANFRGMKPVFKWNSATPWVEMQLSPPTVDLGSMKRLELFNLVFPKVLWLIILIRVTGYCVKNYYMVNRQAVKRTTTYAGKHSAFSAELAATEMLKASSKKGD